MGYRWLVTLILVLHFGFLAYLVFGGFLAWRWPRTFWTHLIAVGWAVAVVAAGLECPLTRAEHWARGRSGEVGPQQGFIERYVEGIFYPERYLPVAQATVLTLVAVSWWGLWRRRSRTVGVS
jgi:hypothetical protein